MPFFNYKCPHCNCIVNDVFVHKFDNEVKCSNCKAVMKRLFSSKFVGAKCFPREGIFLEHVSARGKTFHSEREMRDFEKKTGTTIGRLH